jgi:hypothetical protein
MKMTHRMINPSEGRWNTEAFFQVRSTGADSRATQRKIAGILPAAAAGETKS